MILFFDKNISSRLYLPCFIDALIRIAIGNSFQLIFEEMPILTNPFFNSVIICFDHPNGLP